MKKNTIQQPPSSPESTPSPLPPLPPRNLRRQSTPPAKPLLPPVRYSICEQPVSVQLHYYVEAIRRYDEHHIYLLSRKPTGRSHPYAAASYRWYNEMNQLLYVTRLPDIGEDEHLPEAWKLYKQRFCTGQLAVNAPRLIDRLDRWCRCREGDMPAFLLLETLMPCVYQYGILHRVCSMLQPKSDHQNCVALRDSNSLTWPTFALELDNAAKTGTDFSIIWSSLLDWRSKFQARQCCTLLRGTAQADQRNWLAD